MKIAALTATAILLTLGPSALLAEDPAPAKCAMCEAMKKKADSQAQQSTQVAALTADLDQLVAEMNGSLGPKKVEAMAAVVTRLVEQYKALTIAKAAAKADAPKEQAHQH